MSMETTTGGDNAVEEVARSSPRGLERSLGNSQEKRSSAGESIDPISAHVRVAVELTDAEKDALAKALERRFACRVELHITLDARIMGGIWVQVGDTIIDGSLQGRLEALRHHLRASSRQMILGMGSAGPAEEKKA